MQNNKITEAATTPNQNSEEFETKALKYLDNGKLKKWIFTVHTHVMNAFL